MNASGQVMGLPEPGNLPARGHAAGNRSRRPGVVRASNHRSHPMKGALAWLIGIPIPIIIILYLIDVF